MNVVYEHKKEMTMIGYRTKIRPEEGAVKCVEFWNKEYNEKYSRLWKTMHPETAEERAILENSIGMYAICDEGESGFDYWIAGEYRGGEVPESFELYTFPESDWALFSTKGAMPDALQQLNAKVWNEWYPNEGRAYRGNGNAMLEVYTAGDMHSPDYECGIWIPVLKGRVSGK